MRHGAPIALLLVIATLCVYLQVREHEFVDYDDRQYFLENPLLAKGLSIEGLREALSSPYYGNWIPITSLSILIDHSLYGENAAGFLLTNVAFHALASVLLFLALARMTGSTWRSAFVAGVFALHPLHVESVAWASERKDVLSGFFWMLALLLYARYAEGGDWLRRYQLVAFALVLGLLAKPTLVTLPLVFVLLDYWPLARLEDGPPEGPGGLPSARQIGWALREKLQLIAMALAMSAVAVGVQKESGFTSEDRSLPVAVRVANALESYVFYIVDAFFPHGLAVFYPHPMDDVLGWRAAACGGLLVAISVLVLRGAATRPYLVTGWFWYLGTLVPVIGFVQAGVQARADRYTYLPLVGLAIMVAWGAPDLLGRLLPPKRSRAVLAVSGVAALVALGVAAHTQVSFWRNTRTLFERALAVTDGNFLAHNAIGKLELEEERLDAAAARFAEAGGIVPGWAEPYFGLADVAMRRGALSEAIESYQLGLQRDPGQPRAHAGLGLAFLRAGAFQEAAGHLVIARGLGVESPVIHSGLAHAYSRLGRPDLAVIHNREALRLDPEFHAAANNLVWLLATSADPEIREPEEAVRIGETTVAVAGESAGLLDTLAAAYAAAGRFDEAMATASRAAALAEAADGASQGQKIRSRLALYREGRAYIEELPVPNDPPEAEPPPPEAPEGG